MFLMFKIYESYLFVWLISNILAAAFMNKLLVDLCICMKGFVRLSVSVLEPDTCLSK